MRGREKTVELTALEQNFASANAGGNGYAFISAPVAISALLDVLDGSSHLVVSEGVNPNTYRMIDSIRRRSAGLKVAFADMSDLDALASCVTEETRLLWVETVSGPRLSCADFRQVVAFAKARDILILADNSVMGHGIVKPLAHGCDMVFSYAPTEVGALTEAGQGGARGGLVAFSKQSGFAEDRFSFLQRAYDAMPGPEQAQMLQQALDTYSERVAVRGETAAQLAAYLKEDGNVVELFYPGGGCPDLSLVFRGLSEQVATALARLSRFRPEEVPGQPGTFWHYAYRDYEAVPDVIRRGLDIPDGLVRFAVPAEHPDLLIQDFKTSFG